MQKVITCGLCQTFKLKLSFLEEQIKTLQEKEFQFRKINNNLINMLNTCNGNEDWKVKYEALAIHTHQVQANLKRLQKKYFSNHNLSYKSTNSSNSSTLSPKDNIRKTFTWRQNNNKSCHSTPRNNRSELSSQKMLNFMTIMRKNKMSKVDCQQINKPLQQNSKSKRKIPDSFSSKLSNYTFYTPNKKQSYKSCLQKYCQKFQEETKQFQEVLNKKQHRMLCKKKPKTLIQVLVFND